MPFVEDEKAEIVLSPIGVARRSAMGQFREASDSETLPHHGAIFVMRQAQDAEPRCRVRGSKSPSTLRGQRFGEMEFWALMAYNARHLAHEFLSPARSTSRWLQWEMQVEPQASHQKLGTNALNRFLSLINVNIKQGRFVRGTSNSFPMPCKTLGDFKNARDLLEDNVRFCDQGGLGVIDFERPIEISLESQTFNFERIHVLPPWLRPSIDGRLHPLTKAYLSLLYALFSGKELKPHVKRCVLLGLSPKHGVGAFLRREILGRRLKRSARAIIVPRPDLRIDQVAIPSHVANVLFEDLPDKQRQLVLVNRNPTLHKRGLLALRPLIEDSDRFVFGLSPGVLSVLGADFDGDQLAVFALETEASLRDAMRLIPGGDRRLDEFRSEQPAFPLLRELRRADDELTLARDETITQEEWCDKHQRIVSQQLYVLGDGWETELLQKILTENSKYLAGLSEDEWLENARHEMQKVYASVRKKGQLGGVIRQQLFKRLYVDDGSFSQSVVALQAVTERLTQSALSVKAGRGTAHFDANKFFDDPVSNQHLLATLDPSLDAALIASSLGPSVNPAGVAAWMAKPRLDVLIRAVVETASLSENAVQTSDPRIGWFLD